MAALLYGSACAGPDRIDRTTAPVDVTGLWEGAASATVGHGTLQLLLEQQGSQVQGSIRNYGVMSACATGEGPLEGTVADDVFTFKQTNSPITGEMKVASDQMSGGGSGHCGRFQFTLRRVNTSSSPAPKP
jgi:hypothetical protein